MTGRRLHRRDWLHRQPPPSGKGERVREEANPPTSNTSTEVGVTSPPPPPPPPPTTTTTSSSTSNTYATESRRSTSLRRDHHHQLLKPDLCSTSSSTVAATTGTVGSSELPSGTDNQKVVDAHSLVLAITNHWRLPRSEWLLWVMNHMFRPLSASENKDSYFEVIELTELNLPFWVDTASPPVKVDFGFPTRNTTRDPTGSHPTSTQGTRPGPAYRIVPHTQVYTLYHCYSMVFLLDVSSSLTTIDPYRQAVLVDEVLVNFRQCLAGITQPFVIPSQYRQERYHFQPQIHLSVLADCTQNVPSATSPHRQSSPIRILVHNILLTADNLEETFQLILTQFQTLQAEMADHYHGFLTSYLSPTSLPTRPNLDTEVNSSHLLEAGILSLRLLPQEGSPVVILITDGVADVGRVDFDEGLRTMARDGVLLTVIQVGSNLGFTPGCSFGYVPDNEALRFLAMATGGKFIYATDCPELHHPSHPHDGQPQDHPPPQYPNFYHRLLLIQEARFQRQRHDNRHASVNIGRERVGDLPSQRLLNSQPPGTHSDYKESNFPWSFQAPPPPTEYLLTRYRDYALPLETSCILNARLREGFFIERIALSGSKQSRAEKVHINLTMTWLPNVMIQYRIRAQLPSDMKSYHANSRSKYIRIEMNILASTVFAVSFVNVDATQGSSGTSPLLTNVLSLHQFLKSIFATDDTLKSLNAMLQQFPMLKAPRDRSSSSLLIDSHLLQQLDVESVRALWSSFENSRLDYISNGLFDRFSTMLALIPEWQGQHPPESSTPPLTFRPTDLSPLVTGELGYSCISDTTYIKYLHAQKLGQHNFLSFCILRIIPITHYLMLTRLAFVNVRYSVREMLSRQHAALHAKLAHSNGSTFLVRNCHRPLQSLLVDNRYYPHNRAPIRAVESSNWSANYLVTASKSWLMSSYRETYFPDQGYPTIDQLVFNLLMKAKRAQGFIQIGNHDPHRILFYKEIHSPWQDRTREFGIQYQLAMTSEHITSHIWAEPITSDTFTDGCQTTIQQVLRRDEVVVSNLLAFDSIHHACRSRKNIINQPLRLRSLVLNSVALISHYRCPHVVCDLPLTDQDISPLLRPPYFIPSQKEQPPYLLELDWEEDTFLKFHPVVIHHILFQFYIETNLLSLCDAVITGQIDDPCDTFVETLPTDPLPSGSYRISPTTASLKWGIAKLVTPNSFVLLFIPNAWDMIHSFRQHGSSQHGYLTTWSFECIRENLQNPFQESFNLSVQELTRLQSGPSYSNRYPFIPHYESLHGIIETCDRTEFWTEWSKSQPNVSPSVHQLQSTLDGIYGKAFVQSLYSSLLLGYPIHTHDLHDALNLCWKFHFAINLTDYLNLKTEKCRRHLDQDFQPSYESQFQSKFAMILGYHFGIIPGWRGSYFFKNLYQTSFQVTGDLEPPGESHNEPVTLPRLLEQAANPILMRLHFVYTNPHQSPSTYSVVTNTVPTTYTIPLSELDYSPSQIGTESSPLESADGTSVSIEFTLYIPKPSSPLPPDHAHQIQSLLASEDLLKHPQVGLVLPRHHLRALTETKSRIEWLIKEEVIHGLLTWSPITSHVLHWIDRKLSVRNPFVDFPSSFSMQLKLVDKVAGAALFSRELEHISIHPYCIVRCEEYFYVQPVKSSHPQHPYLSPFLAPRDGDSPLVDGLGISVLDSPDDESNGLNFWMLLVPTPDQVQISFFSKSVAGLERSRIIQRIRRKIGELLRRVNQTLLLDELDTTRQCSKYLLPPDSGDEGTESLTSESDEEPPSSSDQEGGLAQSLSLSDFTAEFQLQVGPSRFKPGQFQCPLQFKEMFTLHWRVKPMIALSHILTSVMHPLYVSNRQNLFVIRDSQAAFYMRLSEFKDASLDDHTKLPGVEGGQLPMDTPTSSHHPASPMLHASIISSYSAIGIATLDSLKDHPPRPGQSSPSIKRMSSSHTIASHHPLFHPAALNASPHLNQRGIALEVYGIQPPGREITQDLVSLIDGRLTNHLTLNIISSYLARNATLKLTPADVQFIFPLKSHPTPMTRVSIPVPPFVLNPLLALLYCKQNLLGYLHLLSGLDGRHQYRQFLHSYYRHWPHPDTCDCFVGDFVFFYNCIASRNPTPVEQALGQGLGLVCLTLTDLNNEPLYQPAAQNLQHVGYRPYRSSKISEIRAMLEGSQGSPEKFQIHADIWTIGSVNSEALQQKVHLSLRQSFSDYMMDCCIKTLQHELPLLSDKRPNRTMSESDKGETRVPDRTISPNLTTKLVSQLGEPSTRILQCGVDLGNPAMLITTLPCELDMASQKLIVAHLHHWLMDYHLHPTPTIWELRDEKLAPLGTPQLESEPLSPPHSMPPCDFLLISGLDLPVRGGGPPQLGSRQSEVTPTRRSSLEDKGSVQSLGRATLKRDGLVDDIQLYPSLHLPHSCSTGPPPLELIRSHLILILANCHQIQICSYNLPPAFTEALSLHIERCISWQQSRAQLGEFGLLPSLSSFHLQDTGHPHPTPVVTVPPSPLELPPSGRSTASESKLDSKPSPIEAQYTRHQDATHTAPSSRHLRSPRTPVSSASRTKPVLESGDFDRVSITFNDEPLPEPHRGSRAITRADSQGQGSQPDPLPATPTPITPEATLGEPVEPRDNSPLNSQEYLDYYSRQLFNSSRALDKLHASNLTEQLQSTYRHWGSSPPESTPVDLEEVLILIQTAHPIHFCHIPLFHFRVPGESSHPQYIFKESDQSHPDFVKWYQLVIQEFQATYGEYLNGLGLQRLGLVVEPTEVTSCPPTLYQRWVDGHLVLVTIAVRAMVVHINVYAVPSLQKPPVIWSDEAMTACLRIKRAIHGLLFGYDFHIHHLQSWLDGRLDATPSTNVLALLGAFQQSSLRPSPSTHHSLTSGTLIPQCSASDIYQYILKSPHRYGMRNIYYDNRSIGFCIAETQAHFRQVIAITLAGDGFHYYALVVSQVRPLDYDRFLGGTSDPPILDPATVIHDQLQAVLSLHTRDTTWKLLQDTPTNLTASELDQLESSFSHLDLFDIEPTLHQLPPDLPWPAIFHHLQTFLPRMARGGTIQSRPTLLLFNPYDSQYLLYLRHQPLQLRAVARDPRSTPRVVECEHVTYLVRTLLYGLWQTLHSPPPA